MAEQWQQQLQPFQISNCPHVQLLNITVPDELGSPGYNSLAADKELIKQWPSHAHPNYVIAGDYLSNIFFSIQPAAVQQAVESNMTLNRLITGLANEPLVCLFFSGGRLGTNSSWQAVDFASVISEVAEGKVTVSLRVGNLRQPSSNSSSTQASTVKEVTGKIEGPQHQLLTVLREAAPGGDLSQVPIWHQPNHGTPFEAATGSLHFKAAYNIPPAAMAERSVEVAVSQLELTPLGRELLMGKPVTYQLHTLLSAASRAHHHDHHQQHPATVAVIDVEEIQVKKHQQTMSMIMTTPAAANALRDSRGSIVLHTSLGTATIRLNPLDRAAFKFAAMLELPSAAVIRQPALLKDTIDRCCNAAVQFSGRADSFPGGAPQIQPRFVTSSGAIVPWHQVGVAGGPDILDLLYTPKGLPLSMVNEQALSHIYSGGGPARIVALAAGPVA